MESQGLGGQGTWFLLGVKQRFLSLHFFSRVKSEAHRQRDTQRPCLRSSAQEKEALRLSPLEGSIGRYCLQVGSGSEFRPTREGIPVIYSPPL